MKTKLPSFTGLAFAALGLGVAMPFIQKMLDAPSFISGTQFAWAFRLEPGCVLAGVEIK